jgi:hypothetical protein
MIEDNTVCVATFTSEIDASLARGVLEASGIESFILKDDCGGWRSYFSRRLVYGL